MNHPQTRLVPAQGTQNRAKSKIRIIEDESSEKQENFERKNSRTMFKPSNSLLHPQQLYQSSIQDQRSQIRLINATHRINPPRNIGPPPLLFPPQLSQSSLEAQASIWADSCALCKCSSVWLKIVQLQTHNRGQDNYHMNCLKQEFLKDPKFFEKNRGINWYSLKFYYEKDDKQQSWVPNFIKAYADFQLQKLNLKPCGSCKILYKEVKDGKSTKCPYCLAWTASQNFNG